ncbi:MAG TPA: FAD-dependent monooxygenase [Candidatus Polarisedimenticolaceae bacterium]|nr:FAD-dependent monooxygenase [Candidatus Polarisedimenticolaceae bacterium]
MASRVDTQVLIVGAGPVGLSAALRLVQAGVAVEVIDEQWRPAGHSYALGLHPASLALLDDVGVAEELIAAGVRVPSMSLFERRERRAQIPVGEGARFPFALSLPQSELETRLAVRLEGMGVRVRWNHRLAGLEPGPRGMNARVDRLVKESGGYAVAHTTWVVDKTIEIHAEFVLGADGHRSMVRRTLGIPFEETGTSRVFAVCECDLDRSIGSELRLVLEGEHVSAMWPLPAGRARWSVELPQVQPPSVRLTDRHKSRLSSRVGEGFYEHLDEAELRAMLVDRAPWFEPLFAGLGWTIEVRFERRLAARIGQDRTWLAGDAVHLTGPVGMQSMNGGLREASQLATTIAKILRGQEAMTALPEMASRTLAEWRFLQGKAGGLRTTSGTPPFVRAHAERLLPCLPAIGDDLDTLADRLGLTVERG